MSARCEAPEPDRVAHDEADVRCLCGALVARLVDGGVEIKCRRCKRVIVVPLLEGRASLDDL